MLNDDLGITQPSQLGEAGGTQPVPPPIKKKREGRCFVRSKPRSLRSGVLWLWILGLVVLFSFGSLVGGLRGYQSARRTIQNEVTAHLAQDLIGQFTLGVQDMAAGRFDVARQRLEYVVYNDPSFPGAVDKLAEVLRILNITATPTPLRPTATPTPTPNPTPTRDLRPVQDLFTQAQTALAEGNWTTVIDLLTNLRKADMAYLTTRVDGLLYLALRNQGVDKIYLGRDLEGGSYDLVLAERFGPLDVAANQARELARLYMYGSAFWEAFPEQAVFYFSQVAAAAPYLTDASGWTALERYRASLIQYGDQLAAKMDWCNAQTQYELAASIRVDESLKATTTFTSFNCAPPTATVTPTASMTPTPSVTATWVEGSETLTPTPSPTEVGLTVTPTPSPTEVGLTVTPTPSPNATLPVTATSTVTMTDIPVITETPTVTPLPTEVPTITPTPVPPSETPTAIPSETPTPIPL